MGRPMKSDHSDEGILNRKLNPQQFVTILIPAVDGLLQ